MPKKYQRDPMTQVDYDVARRMNSRRVDMGVTLYKVAEETGLTYQQISKYFKGKSKVTAGRMYQIAGILRCSVHDFYEPDTEPKEDDHPRKTMTLINNVCNIQSLGRREAIFKLARALSHAN